MERISPILKSIYWLQIKQRITFKVMTITQSSPQQPHGYLFNLLNTMHLLEEQDQSHLSHFKTETHRPTFPVYAVPVLWNSLPC